MEDLSLEVDDAEADLDATEPVDGEVPADEAETAKPKGKSTFVDALEQSGTLDALAEAIVTMYGTPKPVTELFNFFLSNVGVAEQGDIEKILLENQELRKRRDGLRKQIKDIEQRPRMVSVAHIAIAAIADSLGIEIPALTSLSVLEDSAEAIVRSHVKDAKTLCHVTGCFTLKKVHLDMVLESRHSSPLCGYESVPRYSSSTVAVGASDIFVSQESRVSLGSADGGTSQNATEQNTHGVRWVLWSGVALEERPGGYSERRSVKSRCFERSISMPSVAAMTAAPTPNSAAVSAGEIITADLQRFFVKAINLLRSDSVNSIDATLDAISSEVKLALLVPYFLQWCFGKISTYKTPSDMCVVIRLTEAIAVNRYVNAVLYMDALLKIAFAGLVSIMPGCCNDGGAVRREAAGLLSIVLDRCHGGFPSLPNSVFIGLCQVLFDVTRPLACHYGALCGLRVLGAAWFDRLVTHLPCYVSVVRLELASKDRHQVNDARCILSLVRDLVCDRTFSEANSECRNLCTRVMLSLDSCL